MRLVTDVFEFCARELPRWNTISISGYHMREAGATAAQELAFTLADGIAYVEAAVARGLDVDDFAGRLSFFFAAWSELFEEVAKFRAARRMWARIMRDRFGATNPRSMMCRFHVQTAGSQPDRPVDRQQRRPDDDPGARGRARRRPEPAHELARRGARPADRGGRPARPPDPADPRLRGRRDRDARPARRLATSWRSLTDELEAAAQAYLDEIDAHGRHARGDRGAASSSARSRRRPTGSSARSSAGDRIVVGVNRFRDDDGRRPPPIQRIDPEAERAPGRAASAASAPSATPAAWAAALDRLGRRGRAATGNLLPPIIEAVKAYATVGEISDRLRVGVGRAPRADHGLRRTRDADQRDAEPHARRPSAGSGKVHHVAVVVRDLEAALGFWRDILGLPVELVLPIEPTGSRSRSCRSASRRSSWSQPTDDTTGVARFLASKGEGFHHVCFEVAGPRRRR